MEPLDQTEGLLCSIIRTATRKCRQEAVAVLAAVEELDASGCDVNAPSLSIFAYIQARVDKDIFDKYANRRPVR